MKTGLLKATLIFSSMTLLLFFWGCDEDGNMLDSDDTLDGGKVAEDVTPECVRYVDSEIQEPGDGLSWEKAVSSVEEAADLVPDDDCEIWVKGDVESDEEPAELATKSGGYRVVDGFSGNEISRPSLSKMPSENSEVSNHYKLASAAEASVVDEKPIRMIQGESSFQLNGTGFDSPPEPKSYSTSSYVRVYGSSPYLHLDNNVGGNDWYIRNYPQGHLVVDPHPGGNITLIPDGEGNVSIGTDMLDPLNYFNADLFVHTENSGTAWMPDDAILNLSVGGNNDTTNAAVYFSDAEATDTQHFKIKFNASNRDLHFESDNSHVMTMTDHTPGRVGIGTTSPTSTLEVNGAESNGSTGTIEIVDSSDKLVLDGNEIDASGVNDLYINYNTTNDVKICANTNGGNVGIGTTSPNYKLDVLGTIRAEEIIVETGWSDYVFEDDYELMSLQKVEEYIGENGHLPGIPSAKEVHRDGVSLGESQSALLAKIEELTLHLIEQNKRIEALESDN